MNAKKTLLVAATAALMVAPALALPGLAPAAQGNGHRPSTTPNNKDNPGSTQRSTQGTENTGAKGQHGRPSDPGGSHKCKPHNVAYVASGTLVSQTLVMNADGTYSGEVTVEFKRTNHHAAGDKGKTKAYKLENVRVTFGLADTNSDGSVGLDDLKAGDQVKLIGKVTSLVKKCSHSGFTPTTTIRKIVFNAP